MTPEHIVLKVSDDYFWSRVAMAAPEDCWPWLGARNSDGYGCLQRGVGTHLSAHRVAWQSVHGPIPDELVIDHLCRNRACQNPAHMEVVTAAENLGRARRGQRKRFCIHGHDKEGRRTCRVCANEHARRYRAARRASA